MRYAFVIDQSRCIGCHACSLACKAEHDVPIGSYRTWVKYVEKGAFPDVRRFFSVLRCNHCDDAPCMTICPVTALFRRENGIVDFDREACIGCKACMQACPYDALYIHPDHGTAEKCNFCAHRVENEMEPPCATVCPTESIIVGDMDDPASRVSHLISTRQVSVRKPEKGTRPKVFYIEGEPAALTPGMADPSGGYMWADRRGVEKTNYITSRFDPNNGVPTSTESAEKHSNGSTIRRKEPAGDHDPGDISSASGTPPVGWLSSNLPPAAAAQALATAAMQGEADFYTGAWEGLTPTRTVYDVYHDEAVWGWRVSAYLWTKSLAAGALLIATLAPWIGINEGSITLAAPLVGLFFLAITGALLVADLKRPSRFWTILTRPNWDSWLARGAFIIAAFGALAIAWSGAVLAARMGYEHSPLVLRLIRWPLVAAALATAGYSGYLFAQAKARDFWQSPLLSLHLSVQALAAGAGIAVLLSSYSSNLGHKLPRFLAATLMVHLALIAFDEANRALRCGKMGDAAKAARIMLYGRYAKCFWTGISLAVISVGCALWGELIGNVGVFAGLTSLASLAFYEHAWNLAGQAPPLS